MSYCLLPSKQMLERLKVNDTNVCDIYNVKENCRKMITKIPNSKENPLSNDKIKNFNTSDDLKIVFTTQLSKNKNCVLKL